MSSIVNQKEQLVKLINEYHAAGLWIVIDRLPSKSPINEGWSTKRESLPNITRLIRDAAFGHSLGLGLVMGKDSGVLCIDIDVRQCKNNVNKWYEENKPLLNNTCGAVARTPSGGFHYYYKYPPKTTKIFRKKQLKCPEKTYLVDFLGQGGQAVIPPTCFADPKTNTVKKYEWIVGGPESFIKDLTELPKEFEQYFLTRDEGAQAEVKNFQVEKLKKMMPSEDVIYDFILRKHSITQKISEGDRNHKCFLFASEARDWGCSDSQTEGLLHKFVNSMVEMDEEFPRAGELMTIVKSSNQNRANKFPINLVNFLENTGNLAVKSEPQMEDPEYADQVDDKERSIRERQKYVNYILSRYEIRRCPFTDLLYLRPYANEGCRWQLANDAQLVKAIKGEAFFEEEIVNGKKGPELRPMFNIARFEDILSFMQNNEAKVYKKDLLIDVPKWDKVDRIKTIAGRINAKAYDHTQIERIIKTLYCQMFSRIFDGPNALESFALFFISTRQGTGKSALIDALFGGLGQYLGTVMWDSSKDEINRLLARRFLCIELKEDVRYPIDYMTSPYPAGDNDPDRYDNQMQLLAQGLYLYKNNKADYSALSPDIKQIQFDFNQLHTVAESPLKLDEESEDIIQVFYEEALNYLSKKLGDLKRNPSPLLIHRHEEHNFNFFFENGLIPSSVGKTICKLIARSYGMNVNKINKFLTQSYEDCYHKVGLEKVDTRMRFGEELKGVYATKIRVKVWDPTRFQKYLETRRVRVERFLDEVPALMDEVPALVEL